MFRSSLLPAMNSHADTPLTAMPMMATIGTVTPATRAGLASRRTVSRAKARVFPSGEI